MIGLITPQNFVNDAVENFLLGAKIAMALGKAWRSTIDSVVKVDCLSKLYQARSPINMVNLLLRKALQLYAIVILKATFLLRTKNIVPMPLDCILFIMNISMSKGSRPQCALGLGRIVFKII